MTVSPDNHIEVEQKELITEVPVSVLHHLSESAEMLAQVTGQEVITTAPWTGETSFIDPSDQVAKINRGLSERPINSPAPKVQSGEVGLFGQESGR